MRSTSTTSKPKRKEDVDDPALRWAPPPWHTLLIVAVLLGYFSHFSAQAIQSVDEIAHVGTFSRTLFPSQVPLEWVIGLRLLMGSVLLSINTRDFFVCRLDFKTSYLPGSKLKPAIIKYRGLLTKDGTWHQLIKLNTSFSAWSVALLGCSFLLNGSIPLMDAYWGWHVPHSLLRVGVLAWTMAAPASVLVSLVVTYVLWAQDLANGNSTDFYKQPWILLMHTFNSIATFTEVGLLGGLPCRLKDFNSGPIFGIIYVLFAWTVSHARFWTEDFRRDGPQFIYPFFDTTLPNISSLAILGLFAAFISIHFLFSIAESIMVEYIGGGILGHGIAVVALSWTVCRFRD